MRRSTVSSLLGLVSLAAATPYPRNLLRDGPLAHLLTARGCGGAPCGADGQLCCGAGQTCTTLAGNVATCLAPGAAYGLYTTTWTETRTYTSTFMTYWMPAPAPTAGVDCVPPSAEQQACGPICCAGWQTCAFHGQCSLKPGFAEPSTVVVTSDGKITTRYSAPFRVTGTTNVTSRGLGTGLPADTAAAPATSTTAASPALGADAATNGGGLGPGAIAGVALLLLLCFCCIGRGLWGVIFGRSRKSHKRERVDVYEHCYSRHGSVAPSAYSRKDLHSGWYGGGRPAPASDRRDKKKSGGLWLSLAAGATTLLALLNLKKDRRAPPRKVPASTRYDKSYYSYSDATESLSALTPPPVSPTVLD